MRLNQIAYLMIFGLLAFETSAADIVIADAAAPAGNLALWYQQPAAPGMNEALPIGNGTFGGLIYGGTAQERIVLNDISFSTSSPASSPHGAKPLPPRNASTPPPAPRAGGRCEPHMGSTETWPGNGM